MRILVISDLHYERGTHHGADESVALQWFNDIIDKERPEIVIGLGDWGCAWKPEDWRELLKRVKVHAIYGNHDNLALLESLRNSDGVGVLAKDGEVRAIAELRFGFINGIISETYQVKKGIPRNTPLFFLRTAKGLVGVNVLCTHESPILPEYGNRVTPTVGVITAKSAIEVIHPNLALSGHLCAGSYTISSIGPTTVIRIDSSQQERHFALMEPETALFQILNDSRIILERNILLRS